MKKYIVFLILTGLFGFGLMGQNEKVGKELMKVIKTRSRKSVTYVIGCGNGCSNGYE